MVKILYLKRVLFPVEQFPVIDVWLVVMHKLEAIGDHAVVGVDSVWNREFVVVVIQARTPVRGRFTFAERDEAAALHVVRGLHVPDLQEGLGEVD